MTTTYVGPSRYESPANKSPFNIKSSIYSDISGVSQEFKQAIQEVFKDKIIKQDEIKYLLDVANKTNNPDDKKLLKNLIEAQIASKTSSQKIEFTDRGFSFSNCSTEFINSLKKFENRKLSPSDIKELSSLVENYMSSSNQSDSDLAMKIFELLDYINDNSKENLGTGKTTVINFAQRDNTTIFTIDKFDPVIKQYQPADATGPSLFATFENDSSNITNPSGSAIPVQSFVDSSSSKQQTNKGAVGVNLNTTQIGSNSTNPSLGLGFASIDSFGNTIMTGVSYTNIDSSQSFGVNLSYTGVNGSNLTAGASAITNSQGQSGYKVSISGKIIIDPISTTPKK
ncbi:MAG: hypothetical protein U0354_16210 [Candidatus Sericytochromatia bacterium]